MFCSILKQKQSLTGLAMPTVSFVTLVMITSDGDCLKRPAVPLLQMVVKMLKYPPRDC